MFADDFSDLLEQQPFRPLTLFISNGKKYEVKHPELAVVRASVVWFYPDANAAIPVGKRQLVVTLSHIVEIETRSPLSSGNGEAT